jgi:hypothetical protein
LLKDINDWCKDRKLKYVIVFDEAQYLRFGGSVKYDMLLAWSVDNLSNISYILTGSEVGMLKEFLKYDDVDAPLYGRFRNEMNLGRFDRKTAEAFLSKGFEELGKKIDKSEVALAVDRVDGIVGWLTYYGYYRGVRGMGHKDALEKVFDEGSKIAIKEIDALVAKSRKRYLSVLARIAEGKSAWAEIKRAVVANSGAISDTRLNALLQSLIKFGVIEKTQGDTYIIIDPIISYAISKMNGKSRTIYGRDGS